MNFNPVRPAVDAWFNTVKSTSGALYSVTLPSGEYFTVRSLDPVLDLPLIHRWVNLDYAKTYWQMQGPADQLASFYRQVLSNCWSHSFIACLDGEPACQLDAYDPAFDEVGKKYDCMEGDIGIHLLLGPDMRGVTNLSSKIVSAFIRWFFSSSDVRRVIAEPDKSNRAAGWLLRRLNFLFLGEIDLPEKRASLYVMDKSRLALLPAFP